jgi:hypothetical protein
MRNPENMSIHRNGRLLKMMLATTFALFGHTLGSRRKSGMHSSGTGMLQSNTFDFSASPAAARQLMQADNHALRLYYSEYKHVLPWRGNSRYVVIAFL